MKTPEIEIIQDQKRSDSKILKIINILSKKSTVVYSSIFIIVVMVAVFSSKQPEVQDTTELNNKVETSQKSDLGGSRSVADKVTESGVIANLAESADLAVAPSTASLSTSTAILQDAPQVISSVEKPKVLEVSSEKRDIVKYRTETEEVIQAIADKYGITAQTIKWVNNLKVIKLRLGKSCVSYLLTELFIL